MSEVGATGRPLNVLIGAYACNPNQGSEEAVGWDWVRALSTQHRVTVLTAEFHRPDIERHDHDRASLRFIYVPNRRWHYAPTPVWKRIEGSILKPAMNLAYAHWLVDAHRLAQGLLRKEHFDLVHQLTYVGFRFPGRLWKTGLPFVWGPIGGLENTPWRLLPSMGPGGAAYYLGRNVINSWQRRLLRSPRQAARVAGEGLIAATEGIRRELERLYGVESTVIPEVVAPTELSPAHPNEREPGAPLRLVWSGHHLPGKALNLLLAAVARLPPGVDWHLTILGDGPLRTQWRLLARELGVEERCSWPGRVPRREALDLMRQGHVLVISSLKDLTSTVLLEGLALGLPAICLDHCGFADVVTPECGMKIPVSNARAISAGLSAAVERLHGDEPLRRRLAAGALRRAQDYTWKRKLEDLNRVYARTLEAAVAAKRPRVS